MNFEITTNTYQIINHTQRLFFMWRAGQILCSENHDKLYLIKCRLRWIKKFLQRLLLCFALGEGPDRKQMWRFFPVFIKIWFFDTQNSFYIIVRGLKNAFFMPLTPLLYCYMAVLWQSSSGSKEELVSLVVGWKWLFKWKIHFRTHRIII